MQPALKKIGAGDSASTAAALEFVLEAAVVSRKTDTRDSSAGRYAYRKLSYSMTSSVSRCLPGDGARRSRECARAPRSRPDHEPSCSGPNSRQAIVLVQRLGNAPYREGGPHEERQAAQTRPTRSGRRVATRARARA